MKILVLYTSYFSVRRISCFFYFHFGKLSLFKFVSQWKTRTFTRRWAKNKLENRYFVFKVLLGVLS